MEKITFSNRWKARRQNTAKQQIKNHHNIILLLSHANCGFVSQRRRFLAVAQRRCFELNAISLGGDENQKKSIYMLGDTISLWNWSTLIDSQPCYTKK